MRTLSMAASAALMTVTAVSSFSSGKPIEIIPWTTAQGNAQHTGFVDTQLNAKQFKLDWHTKVDTLQDPGVAHTYSQVVVDNAIAYASLNAYVYQNSLQAFSVISGRKLWSQTFGSGEATQPFVDQNRVFMQADVYADPVKSGLYRYYGTTGTGGSIYDFGSTWAHFTSGVYYDGHLYFDNQNEVNSVNYSNKQLDWSSSPMTQYTIWSPAVNKKYVVYKSDDGVTVLDRTSGSKQVTIKDPHSDLGLSQGEVMLVGDRVISVDNGYLTVYNLSSQKVNNSIGPGFKGVPSSDGKVIYTIKDSQLVALDQSSLKTLWAWDLPAGSTVVGNIVSTDNLVFLSMQGSGLNKTVALDKSSHDVDWACDAAGKLSLGMGHLFIVSNDGDLLAYKVASI